MQRGAAGCSIGAAGVQRGVASKMSTAYLRRAFYSLWMAGWPSAAGWLSGAAMGSGVAMDKVHAICVGLRGRFSRPGSDFPVSVGSRRSGLLCSRCSGPAGALNNLAGGAVSRPIAQMAQRGADRGNESKARRGNDSRRIGAMCGRALCLAPF